MLAAAYAAAAVLDGASVISQSDVVWGDANWAVDGTGAMPIGSGDVTASVWVDRDTGELAILTGKSDSFDENAQPVKVGLVRVAFSPPLWNSSFGGTFEQRLNLAEASVEISTTTLSVRIFADALSDAVRVSAIGVDNTTFAVHSRVVPYRRSQPTALGRNLCFPRFETPDVVVGSDRPAALAGAVVWYHENPKNASYVRDTMGNQGVDLDQSGLKDPVAGLVFGAAMSAPGLELDDSGMELVGGAVQGLDLAISIAVKHGDPREWLSAVAGVQSNVVPAAQAVPEHQKFWARVWDRSYLNITGAAGASTEDTAAAKQVMDHAHWQRYLELIQGMRSQAPIKFNGQAFVVNSTGKGWDYRDWGACYWWQNTRQPYYNSLAQGDRDVLGSMFKFYGGMLPYVQARTAAQFNQTSTPISPGGALYPETVTQFGAYNPGDWGCNSSVPRAMGASLNQYIRFHFTGNLELCLLMLDDFLYSGDRSRLAEHAVPVCTAVVSGFRDRFPHRDAQGFVDLFPSQSLETYQCPDPASRESCVTNPTPDVAGLRAVLQRLVALPTGAADPAAVAGWRELLAVVPALPVHDGVVLPAAAGANKRSNSENTALYAVHPFRTYGWGKANLSEAQATYNSRPSPCNDGWCQDVIQAAMLNLTDDAAKMVAARAAAAPAKGFRFPGFAAHYQDFAPSLDHWAFMRTAVNYMLLTPLEDDRQRMVVFPTWPVDKWDVSFKLHGPLNTTVQGACVGGVLQELVVTPAERKGDVEVVGCRKQSVFV